MSRKRKNKDSSGLPVPEAVYEDKPASDGPEISVVESYFSHFDDMFDPGVAQGGFVLNHRNYVKTTAVDGEPVEYRWGSRRPGFPERNKIKGYVEARVNPETMELDPKGRPVVVGGQVLLVRKKKYGDIKREQIKEMATRRHADNLKNSDAFNEARDIAKKLGIENALEEHFESVIEDTTPERKE